MSQQDKPRTFVYFNPRTWEIVLKNEFGSTFYSEEFYESRATCKWAALWDDWAQKNYVKIGEL